VSQLNIFFLSQSLAPTYNFLIISFDGVMYAAHNRQASQDISALMLPETYMRKLADLAFFLQQYEFAFTTYHAVKKDCTDKMPNLFASCQVRTYD
jgi:hypothetical protein